MTESSVLLGEPPREYLSAWYSTPFRVTLALLPALIATTNGKVLPEELELLEDELELLDDELELEDEELLEDDELLEGSGAGVPPPPQPTSATLANAIANQLEIFTR